MRKDMKIVQYKKNNNILKIIKTKINNSWLSRQVTE